MSIQVADQPESHEAAVTPALDAPDATTGGPAEPAPPERPNRLAQLVTELRTGFHELQWGPVVLFALLAGLLMPLALLQSTATSALSFVTGIVPVGMGLLLGRRVRGHYGLHGFAAGVLAALVALIMLTVLLFLTPLGPALQDTALRQGSSAAQAALSAQLLSIGGFLGFSLIIFGTFGASMSGRAEERNRQVREQTKERGGQLERPGSVRGADDIRGLSLPQFGGYVNNLFKKKGFQLRDYRFLDKDKHLDIWMEYEQQLWHLRLSVADKVSTGTIEGLYQEMKAEGCRKGVVLASTEFLPTATKAARGRPIVLIDGALLYQIGEK